MKRSELSRRVRPRDTSTLSLRLWEFTGNALLNLFIWITLVVYLFPLSYMLITSLKTSAQMRDSHARISARVAQDDRADPQLDVGGGVRVGEDRAACALPPDR